MWSILFAQCSCLEFFKDYFRKGLELALIFLVRPTRRILVHNRVLRNCGNSGNNGEPSLFCPAADSAQIIAQQGQSLKRI